MERVGPFICKAFCYHFPLVSEYGWIVYLYVTVYWKNTSAFWWLHCGSCLSILAPILSKVIAELENVVIQIDIVNTRGREWVFTALCFIWGLRQLLEQYHLCLDQFKSKTFCKAEPCNENYSLHEGHFASRMLSLASVWLDIDRKFEWEMMSKISLVSNKGAFSKCQYVINTLTEIRLLDLLSYPLISTFKTPKSSIIR